MKAKRLTALALAALMAASTTSVAFAGERVGADLDFARDGYYKYNSDTNRLESAAKDEFQPGDDVYLRLVEDPYDKFTSKKTYNAYGSWAIGESWVEDIDVVYRKGDVTTSTTTTYDWNFAGTGILTGWNASGTNLSSKDDAAVREELKKKAEYQQYKDKYIKDHYETIEPNTSWTDNQGRYWASEENAKKGNDITGDITTWSISGVDLGGKTYDSRETLIAENLTQIIPDNCIYNNAVYRNAENLVTSLAENKTTDIFVTDEKISANFGTNADFAETNDNVTFKNKIEAYVFEINGQKYYVKSSAVTSISLEDLTGPSGLNIASIQKGSDHLSDYYVTGKGTYVASTAITSTTKTVEQQKTEKGVMLQAQGGYVEKDSNGAKEGTPFVSNVDTKAAEAVDAAIASATITWTPKTTSTTEPQYEYWVKISTKDSATTKDIDVVGKISVGTSKSSAEKEDELSVDFTLTNADPSMDDEYDDYVYIEDGQRAVVKFADDASDEFEVEFGDDARFVFNARGQGKLNLAYNTKFNREFAYDYDSANIDFINFEGEPTTNRTGTLYIYADEDSYIYEVTSKGAKKINGAYYDDDEEAWVIRTRHLTSYAISDKKLKTVDQMDNGSSSGSSNSGSNSGNNNNGKPNPDTGR